MADRDLQKYWKANQRLILALLLIWALVSLVSGVLFVEFFNQFHIGTLPLGFWIAQQGSIFVFVALIFIYAWAMDRIEHRYHLDEGN